MNPIEIAMLIGAAIILFTISRKHGKRMEQKGYRKGKGVVLTAADLMVGADYQVIAIGEAEAGSAFGYLIINGKITPDGSDITHAVVMSRALIKGGEGTDPIKIRDIITKTEDQKIAKVV